ncbi:MAG: sensor histidine kinase [Bdellovibrionales bacterium]|nr:sensor histidine kinase [Bdellovibrionales bacterium]
MSCETSVRLERNINKIMHAWEQRTLREIVASKYEGSVALRDSLPEYLGQLAKALSKTLDHSDASKKLDKDESTRVGKKHGKERAKSINYTMDQMIKEYHILRQVLCEVLEEDAPLNQIEREIIICSIEQAVNDAATQFSESLSSLNDQLNEEKQLRDKFVASLSHDLRTPLTTIKMIAQMLAKKSHGPEEIIKTSARIVTAVDRVDTMIQDLLDFTHFRVGEKLPLNLKVCNLNNICQTTLDELIVIHGNRFVFNAKEQFNILSDCDACRRIIENLATNAVKYGSKSTPITLSLSRKDSTLEISLHNDGNPILAQDLKTIFEPYKRTASAENGTQQGWGIGLPLVRGLAEAHGGFVKVESGVDGTTFTVSIPI